MLESLTLRNWQRHRKLSVAFDPKVSVLVGANDVGKSSILRALRFALLNQPPRGRYVRFGKTSCSARLAVDGRLVGRVKSKRGNTYLLDGKRFSAVGRGVPQEITALVLAGDLNFQGQLDDPFWFTDTAGQAGRNLNAVINLDVIDRALALLAAKLRSARSSVEESKRRVKEFRQRRRELAWVKECAAELDRVTVAERDHSAIVLRRSTIDALVQAGQRSVSVRDRAFRNGLNASAAVSAGLACQRIGRKRQTLATLVQELDLAETKADRPVPDLGPLLAARKAGDEAAERRRNLEMLIEGTTNAEERQWQASRSLSEARRELRRRSKGRCPACGQPVGARPS